MGLRPGTVRPMEGTFSIPIALDLGAVFVGGVTGVLAAMRRGYDFVGVISLALVSGLGGALLRDGVFIQAGPPAFLADSRFLLAIVAATIFGALCQRYIVRINRIIALLDALSLGAYATVGMVKAHQAGMSIPGMILVGMINAIGGGLLRDVLVRTEPLVFKPGQFYALATLAGCLVFVGGIYTLGLHVEMAAYLTILTTFIIRVLTITYNWHTSPFLPSGPLPPEPPN